MSNELELKEVRLIEEQVKEKYGKSLKEFLQESQTIKNEVEKAGIDAEDLRRIEPPKLKAILQRKEAAEDTWTGDLLGYKLNNFEMIAEDLGGLQRGLYLIGGDPNTGKTALLVNLFLDAINSNPEAYGLFFSLDDTAGTIINRMIACMAGISINSVQKPTAIILDYEQKKRKEAYSDLIKLAEDRFNLFDSSVIDDFKRLKFHIEDTQQRLNQKKLIIAIDGLHNLDIGDSETQRTANIERANLIKKLATSFECPILVTVELKKQQNPGKSGNKPSIHDIMESGKYAYNADLIWLIWNEDPKQLEGNNLEITTTLLYDKNKLSSFRSPRYLAFNRVNSKIGMMKDRPTSYHKGNDTSVNKPKKSLWIDDQVYGEEK